MRFYKVGFLLLVASAPFTRLAVRSVAQELHSPEPTQIVNSTQRLTIEQIDSLIKSGQIKDAQSQLQTLIELPTTALVETSTHLQQAATQRIQPYQRLDRWCQSSLEKTLQSQAQKQAYDAQWIKLAEASQKLVQRNKSIREAVSAVARYRATSIGSTLALMLTDLQLESATAMAATETLHANFAEFTRITLQSLNEKASPVSLPWHQLFEFSSSDSELRTLLVKRWQTVVSKDEKLATEVCWRHLTAAAMQPELLDYLAIKIWIAEVVVPSISDTSLRQRLSNLLTDAESWSSVLRIQDTKTAKAPTFDLARRSTWQTQLERWSNGSDSTRINGIDLTPATRPPVGQLHAALPYFPQLRDGKIFVHELNRIRAYDIANGRSWPSSNRNVALFDSETNSAALIPLGYPLVGSPKAGLALGEGCLYARIGSPVTAWASRSKSNDGSSFSSLVGLDLDRQGSMLAGFPLQLKPPQFQDAEFEGVPVISGQAVISAVTERDNVGIRRSLAAFDRFSGALIWRTVALGSGAVVGSDRANLISATQPLLASGLIYYNTDLGSIACVDAASGEVLWLSRYQRVHRVQAEYPRPNRFRYRDGNAAEVNRGMVYCMPQDCAELFALDAFTGQLLWSTSETEVADCTYMAGFYNDCLIVGGDRTIWLNCRTGRPVAQFPLSTTPGTINALPQPRGLGRAAVVGDRVYMTTAETVFVFAADQLNAIGASADSRKSVDSGPEKKRRHNELVPKVAKPLEQFSARFCGNEGGVWCYGQNTLVLATPGRLICFQQQPALNTSPQRQQGILPKY